MEKNNPQEKNNDKHESENKDAKNYNNHNDGALDKIHRRK